MLRIAYGNLPFLISKLFWYFGFALFDFVFPGRLSSIIIIIENGLSNRFENNAINDFVTFMGKKLETVLYSNNN